MYDVLLLLLLLLLLLARTGFPSGVVCFCVRGLFGLKMEAGMCVVYFPEHMAGQQLFVWKMLYLLPAFMLFLVHTGRLHAFWSGPSLCWCHGDLASHLVITPPLPMDCHSDKDPGMLFHYYTTLLSSYRIAGIFCGWKLSQSSWFPGNSRKF